jgi:hypothetical protein
MLELSILLLPLVHSSSLSLVCIYSSCVLCRCYTLVVCFHIYFQGRLATYLLLDNVFSEL